MVFIGYYVAYSGKYKVKKPAKYNGNPENVIYRSLWEKAAFIWCERNANVKSWSSEEIVIPYFWDVDKRYHRYFMDLKITFEDGRTILVEIKPEKETVPPKRPDKSKRYINEAMTYVKNRNKWSAAENYAKDRGWEFEIWTERRLQDLGIIAKESKPLKKITPLKPLRPPKKKK